MIYINNTGYDLDDLVSALGALPEKVAYRKKVKVTFTAESKYKDLQRVKINSDVVLSLMQSGVTQYTDLVAKKSDRCWYISGDKS